jgi:hypothetical protein
MQELFDGYVYADYHQFWVYDGLMDEDELAETIEELPRAASQRLSANGYEVVNQSLIMIRTRARDWCHWIQIFDSATTPTFKEVPALEVNIPISVRGKEIAVRAPTDDEPQVRVPISRGSYQLYVLGYNLGVAPGTSDDELIRQKIPTPRRTFEGYRLVFVPTS